MTSLAELGAGQIAAYVDPALERLVFSTVDADEIAACVDRWCRDHLGSGVAAAWMWRVSVGCVAGVTLDDGRAVVVKAYAPDRSHERLAAVVAAQQRAIAAGIPAARQLAGPHLMRNGFVQPNSRSTSAADPTCSSSPTGRPRRRDGVGSPRRCVAARRSSAS